MYQMLNFETLNSTNTYAIENLEVLSHRSVVCAQTQTKGKGRFERTWISGKANNAYFSIVLKPDLKNIQNFQNLTQLMCVVLCEELEKYSLQPLIKWPNDVLINNKKISGILAQSAFQGGQIEGFVLGVGVNLNLSEGDLLNIDQPATALNLETNKTVDNKEFIKNVLDNFFSKYDEFIEIGFEMIKNDYITRIGMLNTEIIVKNMGKELSGTAKNINDDGTLMLESGDEMFRVTVGDVICLMTD